jgi:hypothetical protein
MFLRTILIAALLLIASQPILAQRSEISIGLNEQFFDSVIDALFQNGAPPEFSIASVGADRENFGRNYGAMRNHPLECRESIRLQRESGGVRTAVRFRNGKIIAPLAFNGSYNPPFVGCVDFSGWAETAIDLEFDEANQRLIARARVLNVSLNGTGGVGGNLIARMVQNSIDRKINPIEILKLEKISFMLPVQNSGNIRMRAVGLRHELQNALLNVFISYEFTKV